MAVTQIKDGFNGGSDAQLKVNPDGSLNVDISSGSVSPNVDIHDSAGNNLTSTAGALNVNTSGTVDTIISGLGTFQTSQYTITTSAQQLTPTPLTGRSSLSIRVSTGGGIAVFIGNSNAVTTATGYPLYNGDTLQMDLTSASSLWAVGNIAGAIVAVLEIA